MKEQDLFVQVFAIKHEQQSVEIHCPNCWTSITRYPKNFYWIDLWFAPDSSGALALYVDCVGCGERQVACPLAFDSEASAHELITVFARTGLGKIPSRYGFISSDWTRQTSLDAAIAMPAEQLGPYLVIQLKSRLVIECDKCGLEHANLPEGALIVGSPLEQLWLVLQDVCSFCQGQIILPVMVDSLDLAPNATNIGTFSGWPWKLPEVKQ